MCSHSKTSIKKAKRGRKHLINTEDLEYVIELVLHSGYIKNADPLSLIISAKVGAGKTELLKRFRGTKGTIFLSEATAYGIKTEFLEDIQSGKIRHIIYGDLLVPLSKQKKTRDDFIAFMNTIIEEGIESVHTYAQHARAQWWRFGSWISRMGRLRSSRSSSIPVWRYSSYRNEAVESPSYPPSFFLKPLRC